MRAFAKRVRRRVTKRKVNNLERYSDLLMAKEAVKYFVEDEPEQEKRPKLTWEDIS